MELENLLQNPDALRNADKLADEIIFKPEIFERLFELIFTENKTIVWRAAWICDKISRKKPEFFTQKHIQKIIKVLPSEKHKGTLRGLLSIFLNLYKGWQLDTNILTLFFDLMISVKADVSHQVLSMKIIARLCENEPAFVPEFQAYLEFLSPNDYTPGFNSCRKNTLKCLKKKQLEFNT
jgi:hypothetical protein